MEAGPDIRTMHPRELVRGLMRGHAPSHKAGYDAPSAVIAVVDLHDELTPDETRETLEAYAEGFAAGMREDQSKTLPAG